LKNSGFLNKTENLGQRKCPKDLKKSLVELPDAIQFPQIHGERLFQQLQGSSPAISSATILGLAAQRALPNSYPNSMLEYVLQQD
jgi:hypothetical protein